MFYRNLVTRLTYNH